MVRPVASLEGFIRKIGKLTAAAGAGQLLYRGHSRDVYDALPSVLRSENHRKSEHLMLRQLMAAHPRDFQGDIGTFDRLVRAQHYGLPTRLLDVTYNPLVALYFAVTANKTSRAKVLVFQPTPEKQKYFDSDVVACLSNMSFLTHSEKNALFLGAIREAQAFESRGFFLDESALERFNERKEVRKLRSLVQIERPHFEPRMQPIDLLRLVSVVPRKSHDRIIAQNGAFLLFGSTGIPIRKSVTNVKVQQLYIEAARKETIMRELSDVGITESSLFPEIEKAAMAIKRRYS